MACAQRGQGRKAVVPHLEWDSNKARRCHGNRRRATPHPPSRERPQGASLSFSRSVFERGKWPSASDPCRSRRLASERGLDKGKENDRPTSRKSKRGTTMQGELRPDVELKAARSRSPPDGLSQAENSERQREKKEPR
ncbi:hypothetical protein G5714_011641 [Onychostoma macrolepis]|uniref:Uncharacterized protein n=1 Tax=Onychostoma macrolepis TaxID=369639 RepID=A0A7J6CIZ8_9TELE|nr:hypothetical protein G5714_011641 [Onychostoma macrolepis]